MLEVVGVDPAQLASRRALSPSDDRAREPDGRVPRDPPLQPLLASQAPG